MIEAHFRYLATAAVFFQNRDRRIFITLTATGGVARVVTAQFSIMVSAALLE